MFLDDVCIRFRVLVCVGHVIWATLASRWLPLAIQDGRALALAGNPVEREITQDNQPADEIALYVGLYVEMISVLYVGGRARCHALKSSQQVPREFIILAQCAHPERPFG